METPRLCRRCGNLIVGRRLNARFCSWQCRDLAHTEANRDKAAAQSREKRRLAGAAYEDFLRNREGG